MNRIFPWLAALALFHACMTQQGYAANTNAVISYKTVDDLCQMADGVDQTKLNVRVLVSSGNKAVHPSDIGMTIQSTTKGMMSLFAPKVKGVTFSFPEASAGKAKVEIMLATTGKREYTADEKGLIKLKLEKAILAENPEVRLSEKPQLIRPDME